MIDPKTAFVYFVRLVKVVAVLTLLLYGAALGMLARNAVDSVTLDNQGKAFAVLANAGYMVFVLTLIIAEFGFQWFERGVYILHFWTGRGILLGWLGIQSMNQGEQMVAVVAGAQSEIDPGVLNTISQVVGWTLISVGMLYILMSVMCLQKLTGGKTMEELDSGFSSQGGAHSSAAEEGRGGKYAANNGAGNNLAAPLNSGMDDEDVKLIQNTATAMGMTVRELRNRFSGASGAREAQRVFEERKALLQASRAPPPPGTGKDQQRESKEHQRERSATTSKAQNESSALTFQASAPPSSGRYESPAFEEDGGRRRIDNDEDLEAMYYAATSGAP